MTEVKPQPLQPEELKAIEARCEAAAAGPWMMRDSVWDGSWAVEGPRGFDQRREPFHLLIDDHYDAAFIAHARTDIPRLLATIEEARRAAPHVGEFCNTCRGRIQIRCAKGCTQYNEAILYSLAAAPKGGEE